MRDQFESPLIQRYASKEMSFLFSPQFKFQTWRKLWIICRKRNGARATNYSRTN